MNAQALKRARNEFLYEKGLENDIEYIANILEAGGLVYDSNYKIRNNISFILEDARIPFKRNVKKGKRNLDLLVAGSVAIIAEIDSSIQKIISAAFSAAKNSNVESIIIITSRNVHIGNEIYGKPVLVMKPGMI